jgi:hypothetical protein
LPEEFEKAIRNRLGLQVGIDGPKLLTIEALDVLADWRFILRGLCPPSLAWMVHCSDIFIHDAEPSLLSS